MSKLITLVPREKRVMYELKRLATAHEWNAFKSIVGEVLGLNESEEVTDTQIEDLLLKIGKELKAAGKAETAPKDIEVDINKLEKGDESGIEIKESNQLITESLVVALIASAPTLLELLGRIIDRLYRWIKLSPAEKEQYDKDKEAYNLAKKTGNKPDGTPVTDDALHHMHDALMKSKAGEWITKAAHWLHNAYVSPLRVLIAGCMYMSEAYDELGWNACWKEAKRPANFLFAICMIGYAGWAAIDSVAHISGLTISALEPIASAVIDTIKGGSMTIGTMKAILGHVHF